MEDLEEWQDLSTDNSDSVKWIQWFTSLEGHEYMVEVCSSMLSRDSPQVDEAYIRDQFNLCGLKAMKNYNTAMDMILGYAPTEEVFLDSLFLELYRSATDLYGMIHARFITSPMGLQMMVRLTALIIYVTAYSCDSMRASFSE